MSLHEAHKARPASSLVVLSPQSADRAQKQATADKLKFNLLVDANNEIGKALGVVYTFPEDLKKRVLAGASQLLSTNWRYRGKRLDRPMSHRRSRLPFGSTCKRL
jgi:hypothetical protein